MKGRIQSLLAVVLAFSTAAGLAGCGGGATATPPGATVLKPTGENEPPQGDRRASQTGNMSAPPGSAPPGVAPGSTPPGGGR